MNVTFKNRGRGREWERTIYLSIQTFLALGKQLIKTNKRRQDTQSKRKGRKSANKRKQKKIEQTTIIMRTGAHHNYVIIMRMKQRRNKSTWQNLKWQLYIKHFPTIFLNNNNYHYSWLIKCCPALTLCLSQLLIINGRTIQT